MVAPITFVTFQMRLSKATRRQLGQITGALRIPDDAGNWIRLLFTSAAHFHPDAHLVLLGDCTAPAPRVHKVEIHRSPAARADDPLWSRLCAEREFLRTSGTGRLDPDSHVAFLDYDVLVNAPLQSAFEAVPGFDVGLTYRRDTGMADMPINAGVILVRGGCHAAALRFFDALLEEYDRNYRDDSWWGEQRALAATAGPDVFLEKPLAVIVRDEVRIGMLPCRHFNYTPQNGEEQYPISEERVLLHFKNDRKVKMAPYWQTRLRTL